MRYYVLDVNPEPWALGDVGVARRGGKMRAYVGPNKQLQFYQEAIKEALREYTPAPQQLSGAVRLRIFYWRNIAKYEGVDGRHIHRNRPDVTNMNKATEDACQGVLFENDRDVSDIQGILVQAGPDVHGAVVIGIEGDNGLNLLDELGDVVMARIRELNTNRPAESDNTWADDDDEPF